ncbi:MAG: type IV secretory system conjugative DNA transfer family protein [Neisseriaceae bacterium]|nr:type IV secretory system conjugative DNA transfer family protein [Neisseriaceae bacterium]
MSKEKIIVGIVMLIVFLTLSIIGGQYVGSMLFVKLSGLPDSATGITTLWNYSHSEYMAYPKIAKFVKLGFVVSGLVAIFPLLIVVIALIAGREKQELHGSTRWAKKGEIISYGLLPTQKQIEKARNGLYPDLLIGAKIGNQYLRFCSNEFALLAAGTRQGKGISFVVPNCLNYQHSLVVYDPKMENYLLTSGHRQKNLKQKVFLFNPAGTMPDFDKMDNPDAKKKAEQLLKDRKKAEKSDDFEFLKSHKWNPYHYISRDLKFMVRDLQNMANILYPLPQVDSGNSKFFALTAQKLFIGLSMYMIETEGVDKDGNPKRPLDEYQGVTSLSLLSKFLTPKDKSLKTFHNWVKYRILGEEPDEDSGIEYRPARAISEKCANYLSAVVNGEEKTAANIITSFAAPLDIFNDPIVEAATSQNDFDFRDLRRQKMSIFVAIQPNDLDRFQILTNLFFSQLINENIKQGLPEHSSQLKYQTLLLIDEFTLLGYMSVFQKGVSFIAGYNLRLALVFQAASQVEGVYKQTGMKTFFSNFTTQTIFAEKDQKAAVEYSDLIGYYTMETKSTGISRGKGFSRSTSTNKSGQKRALRNPDEIKRMAFDKCVVTMTGKYPIDANKLMYYKEKSFKDLVNYAPIPAPDLTVIEPELLGSSNNENAVRAVTQNQIVAEPETKSEEPSMAIRQWTCENLVQQGFFDETSVVSSVVRSFIGDRRTIAFLERFLAKRPQEEVGAFI